MSPPPHPPLRIGTYAAALVVIVLVGLLSRLRPIGLWLYDKSLGDALYAVAVYLVLALLLRRRTPAALGVLTFVLSACIEAFQLTGFAARHAAFPPVRWLLGTHFAWHDLVCYALGAAGVALSDAAARTRASSVTRGPDDHR
ncbi:MAG TPA: DUF2809 domain-containing protein [Armatimonadota bacterium]|nr:DUF2809 domain-containing protein [Armatimonadota bacterium]